MPSDKFVFLGFSPNKQAGRRGLFEAWKSTPATEAKGSVKGEFVVMVAPPEQAAFEEADVLALLMVALKTQKVKAAARDVAGQTGWRASDVYDLALTLKDKA